MEPTPPPPGPPPAPTPGFGPPPPPPVPVPGWAPPPPPPASGFAPSAPAPGSAPPPPPGSAPRGAAPPPPAPVAVLSPAQPWGASAPAAGRPSSYPQPAGLIPTPPRPPRRRLPRGVLVAAAGALVVVLVVTAIGIVRALDARERLAEARTAHAAAVQEFDDAWRDAERDADAAAEAADAASLAAIDGADVLAAATDGLVGATEKATLADAVQQLTVAIDDASALARIDSGLDLAALRADPDDTVEALDAHTEALAAATDRLRARAGEHVAVVGPLEEATGVAVAARDAVVGSVPTLAQQVVAQNPSATNEARLAVLDLAADIAAGYAGPTALADYQVAVQALQASHAAEEAEKAGPLYDERVAVEAFARSISGGVELDFDWAEVVNGFGARPGEYGGYANWWYDHEGYATLTLSNSIAADWGDNRIAAAVVVHEVGHAINAKCRDMQEAATGSDLEMWATAWAISMGYDVEGSGESLYGRPSDGVIAAAAQCR